MVSVPVLKTILTWPDPQLAEKCKDVTSFDQHLDGFIYSMVYTMVQNDGLGLAAPQLGHANNIIVFNKLFEDAYFPMVMINPVIEKITVAEQFSIREGCLSVPGYFENRKRPLGILVKYHDSKGDVHTDEFHRQNAFVIQHEIDHLNGKVFVDGLSEFKKSRILKKIIKKKLGK